MKTQPLPATGGSYTRAPAKPAPAAAAPAPAAAAPAPTPKKPTKE